MAETHFKDTNGSRGRYYMKLKIGSIKTFYLPDNIGSKERLKEVNETLNSLVRFDGEEMTVEEYFRLTWNVEVNGINKTKNTLERIGTYLSKMPEQKGRHDKYVFSRNDVLEMNKGVRWKTTKGIRVLGKSRYTVFSDLGVEDKVSLGLLEENDIK